jgi:hypothetical protein
MRINMTQEEMITKKEIKAALELLQKEEASKGATIRTLFAGGLSVKEISDITTIRYNHVYNVCKMEVLKNNLEADVSTEREGGTKKSQILALLDEGKSITEVSRELGCLYNQVWQIAKAAGLTKKQQAAEAEMAGV